MPELPEVQTIINDLRSPLIGRRIVRALVRSPKTIATPDNFCEAIKGQKILEITRRAKYIVISLSHEMTLLIHLRMTGRFDIVSKDEPLSKHQHVILELDDGKELRFHDTRKFGRWYLTNDPEKVVGKLGPEPLDKSFTLSSFKLMLKGKTRVLKPLLLDQEFIAGLGNIYVDEALWEAKLHPLRSAGDLKDNEIKELHKAIVHVLKKGIDTQGTSLGKGKTNYYRLNGVQGKHQDVLNVFRRTGEPCPRCGTIIERIVVAQRSTHICPKCQTI